MVEGCGKVQVVVLCKVWFEMMVNWCMVVGNIELVFLLWLDFDDVVEVLVGEIILLDGEIIEGIVFVDEFVIIGELVLVICELGGDCFVVMGGIVVLLDWIVVWIIVKQG